MAIHKKIFLTSLMLGGVLIGGCGSSPTEPKVSFKQDVLPILTENCSSCHTANGEGFQKSGFSTESYDAIMKGTNQGKMIVAGDSLSSSLNRMVEGRVDPSIQMPHGGKKLTDEQVKTLKIWVDQGAKNN